MSLKLNTIYHADCVNGMKALDENSIDLTVTSPPYDNLRNYKGYFFDYKETIEQLYRVTKDGGVVVWVVGDATIKGSETGTSFKHALEFMNQGFKLHDTMIYEKNSMSMPDSNRYYQKFEYMFVFVKGKLSTFNPIKDHKITSKRWSTRKTKYDKDGNLIENGTRSLESKEYGTRFNIWKYNTGYTGTSKDKVKHPAMFPVELAYDHIVSWSNEGDTVLDTFMGSGSTAVACVQANRNYIGFEISDEYVRMAENRVKLYKSKNN